MRFKPKGLRTPALAAAIAVTAQAEALVKAATPAVSSPTSDPPPPGGREPRFIRRRQPAAGQGGYSLWDGTDAQLEADPGCRVARLSIKSKNPGHCPYYVIPAADVGNPYAWSAAGYSYTGAVFHPEDEPDEARRTELARITRFRVKQLTDDERDFERGAWPIYRRSGLIGFDLDPEAEATPAALDYAAGEVLAWLDTQDIEARVSNSGNGRHVEVNIEEAGHHTNLFKIFLGMHKAMVEVIGEVPVAGVRLDPSVLNVGNDNRARIWRIPGGLAKDGVSRKTWIAGVDDPRPVTAQQLEVYRAAVENKVGRSKQKRERMVRKAKEIAGTFQPENNAALQPAIDRMRALWNENRAATGNARHDTRVAVAGEFIIRGWTESHTAVILIRATDAGSHEARQAASTTMRRFRSEGADSLRAADYLNRRWKQTDVGLEIAELMPRVEVKTKSAPAAPWDKCGWMEDRLKRRLWSSGSAILDAHPDDTAGKHFRYVASCRALAGRNECGDCNGIRSHPRKSCKRQLCKTCWPALVGGMREAVESADHRKTWTHRRDGSEIGELLVAYTHEFDDYEALDRAVGNVTSIDGLRSKNFYGLRLRGPKPLNDQGPAPTYRRLLIADPKLRSSSEALPYLLASENGDRVLDLELFPIATAWRKVTATEAMNLVAQEQLTHCTTRIRMLRAGWTQELADSLRGVKGKHFQRGTRKTKSDDGFCSWPGRTEGEAQVISKAEADRAGEDAEPLALPPGRHECPGCRGAEVVYCLLYGHGPVEERRVIHRSDYPHSMGQALQLTLEHARMIAEPGEPARWTPFPPRVNPQPTRPG